MMIKRILKLNRKKKRRVRVVRKYIPKDCITKEDEENFQSFMEANAKEGIGSTKAL